MRSELRSRLTAIREGRMWTQGRLAEEAGVSPTTVSGIESGRISRPHFGTVRKLARALGVDPGEMLPAPPESLAQPPTARPAADLSLAWAISSPAEGEFEEGLEGAALDDLLALSRRLEGEQERLRRLYGEAVSAEQRRLIKGRIRDVTARHGSIEVTIAYHPDL